MSNRPFITQDSSPNIIIVPTLSFCGPPPKTTIIDNNKVQTGTCAPALSQSKNSESSLESMSENSVINSSAESSDSKTGDSSQSMQSVNATARPQPSSSWATNYLRSIGDSHSPIKLNLSFSRKKIEALKENASQNKSAQFEGLPPTVIKKGNPIEEARGPKRNQWTANNGSSVSRSKDILTKNIHSANLSSLPKTDFTREETNMKRMKRLSEYETQTTAKKPKISSEIISTNQRLYKDTESHRRHGDKIEAPISSKYIPTPGNYKYNKYNQSSNGHIKTTRDGVKKPSYLCNSSCCTVTKIRNKIKTSQNKIVKTSKQNLKEVPVKKYTTEKHVKSTVIKKPSPIKHKEPYYSTDYLKSYKNYDIQTIKYKEFYNKYKIPKISDRNKNLGETKSSVATENDTNKNRISAKDIFVKELGESDCSTPIKSVVKVADDSDRKANKTVDLRSKLSCRSLNHHFTMLRNLSETERTHTVPIEDREALIITLPNDTDVEVKPTTKRKLEDCIIPKKKENIKTPTKKERISLKTKEVNKSPKMKEVKSPSSKFKKIKLVINVICEKSGTSSSNSEDEESVENSETEKKDFISNLDLSFLDDFNIDEIVESLCGKEKCDLTSYDFKENTADDFILKPEDNIKDIDVTDKNMYSVVSDSENERSLLMDKNIKTDEWTSKSEVNQTATNIEYEKAIQYYSNNNTSLNDSAQEHKINPTDEVPRVSGCKLPMTDIHDSANDTETKQQKKSDSCYGLSVKENLKSEKETNASLVTSKTFDKLMTDNVVAISNEIKHRNEMPVVLETDKLSVGNNNTREAITIPPIANNNMAITKSDNVRSSDLPSENISETISAILKFLETNKTQSSEVSKTSSSTKEIFVLNKMPEINNTVSFETVHNSISIIRESSETNTSNCKPDVLETKEVKVIDKTEDAKKEEKEKETQANSNNACNESDKINNKQDNNKTNAITDINVLDDKREVQEKLEREVLETNKLRINKITEPKELTNKVRTEVDGDIEKQTNYTGKNDEGNDIQQNVDTNQEILHKTDKQDINKNSTIDESNRDLKKDNVELKFEATIQSSPHQGDQSLKTQSLDEKTKDHYTDTQKKKDNDFSSITNVDISEITIDLTNESDEDLEKVKGNDVANDHESVTKNYERHSRQKENCFTNNDVLEISTDIENNYIDFSLMPNTYLSEITIDLTHESNENPDTATLKENCCAKDPDAVKEKCRNNNESVTNTRKGSATEVKENDNTSDDAFVTKTTPESTETREENCVGTEESGTKTNEHKDQSQSETTSQFSVINRRDKVSEDKNKDKPEVTEDSLQMDAALAKKITDKIQQWSKKKHTMKSLIHYGEFSKIYECVNECGDKYAVKIMHGNIVKYRYSKTESILKRLQRDVPKENYHCVYLFQGFGYTTNWCLLTEFYPKNLKQALQENEKSFHINLIQDLSRQLVSAVTLLRHKNIVHTNIKPTHILMNSTNDQLKLCGFDEAQYVGGIQFSRDVGAMNYRAPEIILGHSAGYKMDVWSTALVMYEMATNIQLFPGIVHNDILYKQMFVCGPVPYNMLKSSKFKNEHFSGLTFMRQMKGGKCVKIPYHTICKHDLVKKYVYLTYKKDWHGVTSYKQKQIDYAKLQDFCQLIHKMLAMDPNQRLPIEFVFADPFIYETTTASS